MKCIVLKPSHIQGFLCNFKIEGDISISFGKNGLGHPVLDTIFVALLMFCQLGDRLYIYLTSNQEESSNELLSSFTLIVALAVRIGSNLISKLANLPGSFDRALFQFGIMVFIQIVILLNHKSTREYVLGNIQDLQS